MLSRAERLACLAILLMAAVVTLYPLVTLVSTALAPLNSGSGGISFGPRPSLAAFGYAWRTGDFSAYMLLVYLFAQRSFIAGLFAGSVVE